MKVCNKCKIEKELDEFHKRTSNKTDGRQPICIECKRAADIIRSLDPNVKLKQRQANDRQRKIARQAMYDYMTDKACITCGENHRACLQFDHRDEVEKDFDVSFGVSSGYCWDTVKKEIDKCDILCANCHHKRTAIQFNWYRNVVKNE